MTLMKQNSILRLLNSIRCNFWSFFNIATIGVRIIAIKDGKILLVHHTYRENWYLPGGGVKRKETLEHAVLRELYEETGTHIRDLQFIGAYTDLTEGRTDYVNLFFGKIIETDLVKNFEISEYRFFELNQLPDNIDNQCRRAIIENCLTKPCM